MDYALKTYPLTYPQKSIWCLEKLYPDTGIGNIAATLRIDEPVDYALMNQGVNLMLRRNEGFRLRFLENEGSIRQYVADYREYRMDFLDFSQVSRERLFDWDQKQTKTPFALLDADLFYFALVKISENSYGFYVRIHHLVADAWSLVQLGNEVVSNYMLLKHNQPLPAHDNPSYLDFISSEQTYLQSERFACDRAFWQEKFANLPELVTLKTRISNRMGLQAKRKSFSIPDKLVKKIKSYCTENRTSLFALFFAAFCIYINRVKDCQDLVIGTPVLNRSNAREKKTIGMFISTVPIRINIDGEMSFATFSKMVDKEWFSVLKHQKYPYDDLVKDIRERNKGVEKLFDLAISYQNAKVNKDDYAVKLESRWHFNEYQVESLYLHINDREDDGTLILNYDYLIDHYYAKEIEFIHDHLIRLLWHALDNPARKLSDIHMLSEKEKETVLFTFNSRHADYPRSATVGSLFEQQAAAQPDACALICGADRLTYGELNAKANRAARMLRAKGVGPEIIVGIMLHRSLEMMISILAVVKAGGAYLPIDPDYPGDRIRYMLQNSRIRFLLSKPDLVAGLSGDCDCDVIDVDRASFYDIGAQAGENLPPLNKPRDLLYVIYTSGSTGNPKGSLIEHKNVVRLLFNDQFQFEFSAKDCWTLYHSYCFDFSVWEMYGALLYGGRLVIVPKVMARDPECLLDLLNQEQVTVLNQTPAAFYNLIDAESRRPVQALALRYVIFGGEALKPILLKPFRRKYPETRLINMYGITETTVHVTFLELSDEDIDKNICNIGKPIPTTSVYILDQKLNPLPIGVAGELCVGGDGVGRGYLHLDSLTAEKFIANPYLEGDVLYRSGDLARFFAKGDIEYLGRIDSQVKIRGHRVELGEIESRMLKFGKIREVVVTTRDTVNGSKQLCAYYVPSTLFEDADLRSYLVRQLPDFMIPSFLVKVDRLPINGNGKIDREHLPPPDSAALFRAAYVKPQDERQAAIAQIWCDVLDLKQVGINDNFFLLGGDSLSAVAVVSMIGCQVTFADLYQNPTIKSLAEAIAHKERQAAETDAGADADSNAAADHRYLMRLTGRSSHILASIICFPYGGGNGASYMDLADALAKRSEHYAGYAVQLPGHDIGVDQPLLPIREIAPRLALEIMTAAQGELILYGHCVGSALAVETAYCLGRAKIDIKAVFLGGILPPVRKGPLGRYYDPWRIISDRGIIKFLGRIGLPDVQVSESHLKQIIRAFRHDVRNYYNYFHEYANCHPDKLTMPVFCVIGDRDSTTRQFEKKYLKWSCMAAQIALRVLKDADHYFIRTHADELAELLVDPEKKGDCLCLLPC